MTTATPEGLSPAVPVGPSSDLRPADRSGEPHRHRDDGERRPVLVTGGAGFIGSHLVDALIARGRRVVVVDNFDAYYDPADKRRNLAAHASSRACTLVEGDIRQPDVIERAFALGPFEAVVHLAARAGVRSSLRDPVGYEDVNVRGTVMLLERVRGDACTHVVFGSSSSVYGSDSVAPFSEAAAADRPSSPYAATKRSAELVCHSYHHLYGIPVTCLRFFTVYGPRQRPEMAIHRFTRLIAAGSEIELYGDGSARRDYTYVDDIVAGVLAALDTPDGYRIFNLGTSDTIALVDMAEMLATRLRRPLRVRHLPDQPGDVPLTFADITAASLALGYRPRIRFAEGVDRFVDWFERRGARHPSPAPPAVVRADITGGMSARRPGEGAGVGLRRTG